MRTIALFLLLVIPSTSLADTIHVPGEYPTIQGGIDAAVNGDVVLVAPGTYVENIDFLGKAVTVKSSGGAEVTVVDGGCPVDPDFGSVVTFISGEGVDSVLNGFTIINGTGRVHIPTFYSGGGIYCFGSSPTVINNIITENTVNNSGGGIYCKYGSFPRLENNIITENMGNGIYCHEHSSPLIKNNSITANTSVTWGGGIFCGLYSSPVILDNTIAHNEADGYGGGIVCYHNSSPDIINNDISYNRGSTGGGIMFWPGSSPAIISNNIAWNTALTDGGGIDARSDALKITNNFITRNSADYRGGGICCRNDSTNNTIIHNSAEKGGGIYCYHNSILTVTNTILWDNTASAGPEICIGKLSSYTCTLTVRFSDVKGGQASVFIEAGSTLNWGPGNIDADPLFVDPTNSDFHLTYNSPCQDTGDSSAVSELFDFEGDPRIAYGTVDMGADEFHPHLYYTGNATPGQSIDLKFIGIPNDTVRLWIGSGVLDPPLHHPTYGDWYLEAPILLSMILGNIPAGGMYALLVSIPPDYTPWDIPLQAGIGMGLSNLCLVGVD